MPLTSNWNIWTPDDADNYDFIVDSAATAQTVDDALTAVASSANAFKGTVAQRTAFTSTAVDGMLWQDTDDIKMIWRKDGSAWAPAVWRWSGTTTQMNSFAAPNGFEWFNTTDNSDYVRLGGAWVVSKPFISCVQNGSIVINSAVWIQVQDSQLSVESSRGFAALSSGIVIPRDGTYQINASFSVGVNGPWLLAIKKNNFAAGDTNAIARQGSETSAVTSAQSASLLAQLVAGDKISLALWNNRSAGPFGVSGTRLSAMLV